MIFNSEKFIKRGDEQQILRGYFNLKWVFRLTRAPWMSKFRLSTSICMKCTGKFLKTESFPVLQFDFVENITRLRNY